MVPRQEFKSQEMSPSLRIGPEGLKGFTFTSNNPIRAHVRGSIRIQGINGSHLQILINTQFRRCSVYFFNLYHAAQELERLRCEVLIAFREAYPAFRPASWCAEQYRREYGEGTRAEDHGAEAIKRFSALVFEGKVAAFPGR